MPENGEIKTKEPTIQIAAAVLPLQGRVIAGIAVQKGEDFKQLSFASVRSCDIDDGIPTDFPRFVESVRESVSEAAKKAEVAEIFSLTIGLSGGPVVGLNSRGAVILGSSPKTINSEDLSKAIAASGKIELPSDRKVLNVIPVSFAVDDKRRLDNPEGLEGTRLECESHIITCRTEAFDNLVRSVTKSGWKVETVFYDGWANTISLLSQSDLSVTTLIIDVAERSTDVMLLSKGKPRYTAMFPFGQKELVARIAREFNVSHLTAECILDAHASVNVRGDFMLERGIEVSFDAAEGFPPAKITLGAIWDIVDEHYRGFIESVRKSLESRDLIAGIDSVVLGGYSSNVTGLVELCRGVFKSSVRTGRVEVSKSGRKDPLSSRLTGLLRLTFAHRAHSMTTPAEGDAPISSRVRKWLENWI